MCWKYLEQYMVFFVDLFLELRLRFVVSAVLVCISEFLFVFVFVVLFAFVFIYACVLRVCVCVIQCGAIQSLWMRCPILRFSCLFSSLSLSPSHSYSRTFLW